MSAEDRAALWENDDMRYQVYTTATPEEQLVMRREYEQYIQERYPVGAAALEAASIEVQLHES